MKKDENAKKKTIFQLTEMQKSKKETERKHTQTKTMIGAKQWDISMVQVVLQKVSCKRIVYR